MRESGIRVRFAPSPTGHLHIGGARTALFNWLFARHHGGKYLLRIEDTDVERSTKEYEESILAAFRWLGLGWDEDLVYQSQRAARHGEIAEQLLASGRAYRCYCTREELDAMRAAQMARGETARYDRRCRDRSGPTPDRASVVRLAVPLQGDVTFTDCVLGDNRVAASELDDFVLVRSDGVPTYNFAVVVDDHDMGVTHVIRGDGHLANTPKQILIYRALGWPAPEFAHLPLILGRDRKPLSKRHGATSVLDYREQGFLPEALINYLARLGWAHGDQEIFTVEELIEYFDLPEVNKAPAVWDLEKLKWVNEQHKRMRVPEKEPTTAEAEEFYAKRPQVLAKLQEEIRNALAAGTPKDPPYLQTIPSYWWPTVVANATMRGSTMVESAATAGFAMNSIERVRIDEEAARKHLRPEIRAALVSLRNRLSSLPPMPREPELIEVVEQVVKEYGLKLGKLAQPVRVSLTGSSASWGIYSILAVLGRDEAIRRLDRAVAMIPPE
ncbi:glutamate--tRNA ligase [bacterium]|nr:glutamate--tRNA ligase [bacterium]